MKMRGNIGRSPSPGYLSGDRGKPVPTFAGDPLSKAPHNERTTTPEREP